MTSFLIKTYVDGINNIWKETAAEEDDKVERDDESANEFANALSVLTGNISKSNSAVADKRSDELSIGDGAFISAVNETEKNDSDSNEEEYFDTTGQSLSDRFSVLNKSPSLEEFSILENSKIDKSGFDIIGHLGDGLMTAAKLATGGLLKAV
ncbi:MAG: hypothetical protein ACI4NE_04125 [Succinivibrio sp.]